MDHLTLASNAKDRHAGVGPGLTIAITRFTSRQLASSPQRGTLVSGTWRRFTEWLSRPVVSTRKDSVGGFSLAEFRGGGYGSSSSGTGAAGAVGGSGYLQVFYLVAANAA